MWVHETDVFSQHDTDAMLQRVEMGGFNAVFVDVFVYGHALFESSLAEMYPRIDRGFNPLAYLVEEAHRRDIEVHAWFVNGPVAYKGDSPIIDAHPDWAIEGPDGKTTTWLNFSRPDVRQYLSDLMWEAVDRYGADGVHFDYTRYPGTEWGFDAYSVEAFAQAYGFSADELRYADLPAYGLFKGRPLIDPISARVLASFDNGLPAVTLNAYGQGEVVVLNWNAIDREVGIGGALLQRSLDYLLDGGQVYLLRVEENVQRNGEERLEAGGAWLEDLGRPHRVATEAEIASLSADSALVLPAVFVMPPGTAAALAGFVQRGGGLIFIGGPVQALGLEDVRSLTGMQARGDNFDEWMVMTADEDHPVIPSSSRPADLALFQARDAQWREFRKQGINLLVEGIYHRIKAAHPEADVSVTITSDAAEAEDRVLQDWRAWLEGGYVDYIIPRAYLDTVAELETLLQAWRPDIERYGRITLGLSTFIGKGQSRVSKSPEQLLAELDLALGAGSDGVLLWVYNEISDDQLEMLAATFSPPGLHR